MKISIQFYNQPILEICVDDTKTGRLFFDLSVEQAKNQKPFYRDTAVYTKEYMIELAKQARTAFGWNWLADNYDLTITAQLHKDLENYVGKLGFSQIPEEYDTLLYDLHHCLHAIQNVNTQSVRNSNLQIEYLTDNSVQLPDDFEFVEQSKYGDLILINPYVGHNPLQIYNENDFNSLSTTCCFHDIIKPGIVIAYPSNTSKNAILEKFVKKDPDFVRLHGEEKIKYYAGNAVIGRVINYTKFTQIMQADKLVLEQVNFIDN